MIAEFIKNYKDLGTQGVVIILMAWLVWYLVRSIMGMLKNELKDLHKDGEKNAELNRQSINMMEKHNDNSKDAWGKLLKTLNNILNLSNGNNPKINKLIKEVDNLKEIVDRRKDNKPVEQERRN